MSAIRPPSLNAARRYLFPFDAFPLLSILRANGLVDELARVYRDPLGELAGKLYSQPRVQAALAAARNRSLPAQALFHHCISLNSCQDKGRSAKICRLGGAAKVAVYLQPRCWRLGNLPPAPAARPFIYWDWLRARPVNAIQRAAFGDRIPPQVAFRRKDFRQNVPLGSWLEPAIKRLEWSTPVSVRHLRLMAGLRLDERLGSDLLAHLALWHALLIERPATAAWAPLSIR